MARNNLPPEAQQYLRERDSKLADLEKRLSSIESLRVNDQLMRMTQMVGASSTPIQTWASMSDEKTVELQPWGNYLSVIYSVEIDFHYAGAYAGFTQEITPYVVITAPDGGGSAAVANNGSRFWQPADQTFWRHTASGIIVLEGIDSSIQTGSWLQMGAWIEEESTPNLYQTSISSQGMIVYQNKDHYTV